MLLHQLQGLVAHGLGPFALQHAHPQRVPIDLQEVQSRLHAHLLHHTLDLLQVKG